MAAGSSEVISVPNVNRKAATKGGLSNDSSLVDQAAPKINRLASQPRYCAATSVSHFPRPVGFAVNVNDFPAIDAALPVANE